MGAVLAAVFIAPSPICFAAAAGAETRAGTSITNIATTKSIGAGDGGIVSSNPVTLTVAERLDVALARADDATIVVSTGAGVPVLIVNRGNGREAFDIAAQASDASATVQLIAVDRDGDGRFDAAVDTLLANGRTPELEPGETLRLLVVLNPAGADVTASSLTTIARAATGSGPQGTAFPARGDGGGDALAGPTGARADLVVPIGAGRGAPPVLVKSQSVRAPDGSATPVNGAVITYRLEARFAGPAVAVRIDDPIPQGTLYVPGSLTLDAARLSDADDTDAGRGSDDAIAVTLGDIAAATTRIIQFQVIIP